MIKVAIVFPVYNGINFTKQCLNYLYSKILNHTGVTFYVVIVDDGSSDGSYEWIRQNFPQVSLLKGNGNLWWSGGINKAVTFSLDELKTDYILWWNNDIVPQDDYFKNLVEIVKSSEFNIIIGSKICHLHSKSTIWSMGGFFNPGNGKKYLIGSGESIINGNNQIIECDWLPGMGTLTHRSVYEKIGLLDEQNFPQYHGDSDFTYRAKKAGYQIIVQPGLTIFNDTRHSGIRHNDSIKLLFQSLKTLRSNYNIKKDLLFYRKHSESLLAYFVLLEKYTRYIGGFMKWKLLKVFHIQRNTN